MDIKYIQESAIKAILYELTVSNKLTLVSITSKGSHNDMDKFMFIDSAISLMDYFGKTAKLAESKEEDFNKIFEKLRAIGIEAEKTMYKATNGVNTHKGVIFSLGILAFSSAYLYNNKQKVSFEVICELSAKIAKKSIEDFDKNSENTYGIKLYKKYHITGVRGEVSSAFPSLSNGAFKSMQDNIKSGKDFETTLLDTLIHIMQICEDSNIFGRGEKLYNDGMNELKKIQQKAKDIVAHGGVFTDEGKKKLSLLSEYMQTKHLSPGGSADMLICAIFIHLIINKDYKCS